MENIQITDRKQQHRQKTTTQIEISTSQIENNNIDRQQQHRQKTTTQIENNNTDRKQ